MKVRFEFQLADCWVGAFWRQDQDFWHMWICIVPCFPLHIMKDRRKGINRMKKMAGNGVKGQEVKRINAEIARAHKRLGLKPVKK